MIHPSQEAVIKMYMFNNCLNRIFTNQKKQKETTENILILCKQTFKDIEKLYRFLAGSDESYEDFKVVCKKHEKTKSTVFFFLIA